LREEADLIRESRTDEAQAADTDIETDLGMINEDKLNLAQLVVDKARLKIKKVLDAEA
jgi:hypothetical protein